MIFLIEYDRSLGKLVTFKEFTGERRNDAEDERLRLELDLSRRGVAHEVVLLEATSEDVLRRTHRRYFETLAELVEPI